MTSWASLAPIAPPDRDEPDPHHLLFENTHPVLGTSFEGRINCGLWNHD